MRVNTIIITGNLTSDVKTQYTENKVAIHKFCIAHNKSYKDRQGKYQTQTSFINVKLIGKHEWLIPKLVKGAYALVSGELQVTKSDKGTWIEIVANSCQVENKRADENNEPNQNYESKQNYEPDPLDSADGMPF